MKVHGSPTSENQIETRLRCPICLAVFRTGFDCCPADGGALAPWDGDPLIGTEMAGRYIVEDLVGEGSMGLIYRAHHVSLPRWFAIKILFGDLVADPRMRMRFAQEAALASRLSHPNVVPVVDFGRSVSGLLYLVMDFVEGETLSDVIARSSPLDQVDAIRLTRQLAQGLGHAHKRGLVHRDFKPGNVLLEQQEEGLTARILDFGLAISIRDREELPGRLTECGFIIGTPVYIAPEQVMDLEVDHRADLFALGVVLYEMLAGKPPFDGRPVEIAHKNVIEQPPSIAARAPGVEVAPEVEAIVRRLMAKEPGDRFASAEELCAALDEVEARIAPDRPPPAQRFTTEMVKPVIDLRDARDGRDTRPGKPSTRRTSWMRHVTPTLARKLAVGGALMFAAGVVAYALAGRQGGSATMETGVSGVSAAAAAPLPAPVPPPHPASVPAAPAGEPTGLPRSAPLPTGADEPELLRQARPAQLASKSPRREAPSMAIREPRLAMMREEPAEAPRAEAREARVEARVEARAEARAEAPRAAGSRAPAVTPAAATQAAVTPLALGGVQSLPAASVADDPVPRTALTPARPRGPIVVPPYRTRREGNPPPIRFPLWEQVPKQITAKLCIDPRGQVTSVNVLSRVSPPGRTVVERALSQWRYRPITEGTEKVAACFATTFRVQVD